MVETGEVGAKSGTSREAGDFSRSKDDGNGHEQRQAEQSINIDEIDKMLSETIHYSDSGHGQSNTEGSASLNEVRRFLDEGRAQSDDGGKRVHEEDKDDNKRQKITAVGSVSSTGDDGVDAHSGESIHEDSAQQEGHNLGLSGFVGKEDDEGDSESSSEQTRNDNNGGLTHKELIRPGGDESTSLDEGRTKALDSDESKEEREQHTAQSEGGMDTVYHDGIAVPANSELLNTNTAYAAYSALSSQVPPMAVLTNAHLVALPLPILAPDYLPPRIQLLINTLPTLDNLATQLLRVVAIGPYQRIIDLASNSDTPAGAAYRDLTSMFEFTKRLYSEEDPFLTVEHIAPGMWKEGDKTPSMFRSREQSIESTLRKVNLATFLAATLGTIEVGFFHLNESFLDVFCPVNNLDPANALSNMHFNNMSLQSGINTVIGDKVGKLLKPQAVLYLELKTQAYISAIEAGERSSEEISEDIFPSNLEELILSRRSTKILSPTEIDFLERSRSRRDILLNHPQDRNLSEEYEWFSFLKELFDYVSKNMGFLVWGKKGRNSRERQVASKENTERKVHSQEDTLENTPSSPTAAPSLTSNANQGLRNQEIQDITSSLLPSEIQEQQLHLRINPGSAVRNLQRRPWTREEEKALRHALELKGPQWSTILELFGNGGKISEALKNRSQVQLKDKARNWKMFFLKSGLPVPAYLQKVTGDLERDDRSRANKRASRNKKTASAPIPDPIQKS